MRTERGKDAGATLGLERGEDPARWLRMFWALALGLLPVTLMLVGGLKATQTIVLVVSLPILLIGIVMSFALLKTLNELHPRTAP